MPARHFYDLGYRFSGARRIHGDEKLH
jgi:hypothetical protein